VITSGWIRRRRRRLIVVTTAIAAVTGTILLTQFLAGQGLSRAGQWADVLGLALAAISAVTALWLTWQAQPASHKDELRELGADPLLPAEPRKVGGYRLLGRLGEGAFGEVYLGRGRDGALAAIKVLNLREARKADSRKRFAREWQTFKRVSAQASEQALGSRFPLCWAPTPRPNSRGWRPGTNRG
jgi:hypothetical protein